MTKRVTSTEVAVVSHITVDSNPSLVGRCRKLDDPVNVICTTGTSEDVRMDSDVDDRWSPRITSGDGKVLLERLQQ
jgi:hypothetical protein